MFRIHEYGRSVTAFEVADCCHGRRPPCCKYNSRGTMRTLEALGLDALDEALYGALLDDPDLEIESAAARLGRSVTEVIAAWRHLSDKGLIRRSARRPGRFYPVHPEAGLGRLIAEREAELARQQ